MSTKKRIIAYYDGSNFYHCVKNNYGITKINFHHITRQIMNLDYEDLVKIKYFNSPVSQQENPRSYSKQQKFFEALKKTPFLEFFLGRLVKRPLNKLNINCVFGCGHQKADYIKCPKCNKDIDITKCYKSTEKGVDVKLAIHMLLDALKNKYDAAFLFSGDADYCPAIKYIVKELKKEVIFCRFPSPKTNELIKECSDYRLLTKEMVEKSQIK